MRFANRMKPSISFERLRLFLRGSSLVLGSLAANNDNVKREDEILKAH
jgi:hypothetical protein